MKVGYVEYPPIVEQSHVAPRGLLIDYANEVFRSAGYTVQWKELSIPRGIFQLQNREVDALLMLLKNEAREKIVSFSTTALFEARPALCSKAGRLSLPMNTRLRVAHSLATWMPEVIRRHRLVSVSPGNVTGRLLAMLEADRIDAFFYVNPELLSLYLLKMQKPFDVECFVFEKDRLHVHLAFSKNIPEKMEQMLNISLAWHHSQGSFESYLRKRLSKFRTDRLRLQVVDSGLFRIAAQKRENGKR